MLFFEVVLNVAPTSLFERTFDFPRTFVRKSDHFLPRINHLTQSNINRGSAGRKFPYMLDRRYAYIILFLSLSMSVWHVF